MTLLEWLIALSADEACLFLLPFFVALVALLGDRLRDAVPVPAPQR